MRYFSVSTTTTNTNNEGKSGWKLPEKDEDYQRYLMRYENVVDNEFLEAMRDNYVKWGFKNFTDKQKQGIRNCVGHSSTRLRRVESILINVIINCDTDKILKNTIIGIISCRS